ncbi:glycosyltransferase family 4 protein [Candidatus Microgenomates bacterium]|nr:glycosyltransferase family 4 protein [Candidatus Microgenomates bacterium]
MNILVFSWRDPKHPLAGGAEQVMHQHMKGWIKAGYQVMLFSSRFPNSQPEEYIGGVKIIRGGYQYLGVQIAGFYYYLKNKSNFDFIVDQFHGLPFFTPLYVRKPKLAVIQETARKVWFLNPLPRPLNWVIGLLGYWVEPFIFLIYKKTPFMTGSESAKADVIKMGIPPKNIAVIPHGVITTKLKVKSTKLKVKTVVYLGILSKDKGIEDAIKCFSLLPPTWQFWVIGKPETAKYFNQLKRLVNKLNLSKKIKFWGYVTQAKKFTLLSRSHILVNPSVHEGWGLVNIEANSVGTPVVAYKSQGIIDSIEEGVSGILCSQNSPENLASNIVDLLANQKEYQKLQQGALRWSKNFDWNKSRQQSLQLVKKVYSFY